MYEMLAEINRKIDKRLESIASRIGYDFDISKAKNEVFAQLSSIQGLSLKAKFEITNLLAKEVERLDVFTSLSEEWKSEYVHYLLEEKYKYNGSTDCRPWKSEDQQILAAVPMRNRRALEFYEGKPPNGQKTVWKMHEFRVNGVTRKKTSADDMRLDDWVLCRVYAKSSRVINNRKSPLQANREAALVTNQEMIENASIVPENPEQNMINTDFSVQDLLQESDLRLSYFQSYNLDGIVAPIEQQLMNNPYVNGELLPLPLPNVDAQQENIDTNFYAPMPNKT
ncbi:NAC domain-containing protein 26-like [Salvia miltiorrhiza]|uniref:NAC domain-containing protein 26-like n=1 Tax=Salvia miltiorrhiza TaxID=226208 RepID=UPI0025AD2CB1|nr:NAC domain-containing protein 26-like [Salvia miltiorrhiza]